MKSVELKMDHLSESTELYQKTPHYLFHISIYAISALMIVFLIWSSVSVMEETVITNARWQKEDNVIVGNEIAGRVNKVYVRNGQQVQVGDPLVELDFLENDQWKQKILRSNQRIEMLKHYQKYLKGEITDLILSDNLFYQEFSSRQRAVAFGLVNRVVERINVERELGEYLEKQDQYQNYQKRLRLVAEQAGEVNFLQEVHQGLLLSPNTNLLVISPNNASEYHLEMYVADDEIQKIKVGQKVKVKIAVDQNSRLIDTMVDSVSAEGKMDQGTGRVFYLVKATVVKDNLPHGFRPFSKKKVEARIITRTQTFLEYLLRKIKMVK